MLARIVASLSDELNKTDASLATSASTNSCSTAIIETELIRHSEMFTEKWMQHKKQINTYIETSGKCGRRNDEHYQNQLCVRQTWKQKDIILRAPPNSTVGLLRYIIYVSSQIVKVTTHRKHLQRRNISSQSRDRDPRWWCDTKTKGK